MTSGTPSLKIDTRWDGSHGIGRYAREVVSRLAVPWEHLGAMGSPSSPREAWRRDAGLASSDVVYSPGYNASRVSRALQLVTVHDLIHMAVGGPKGALYRVYYDAVVKPIIKRARSVITVSETSASAIRQWVDDDHVEVVNAGIGVSDAFVPDGPVFEAERPYVMYVGNLRAHKNTATLFEAVAHTDFALTLLLPSAEHEAASHAAEAAGIAHRCEILSGVSDGELARLYRGASVTAMPSLVEGFGLPALESSMSGTSVVYWSGCAAVAESAGASGVPVASATDAREWAATLVAAAHAGPSVRGDRASFDWERTSHVVGKALLSVGASVSGRRP